MAAAAKKDVYIPTEDERQQALNKAVLGLFQQKASSFLMAIYCAHEVVWDSSIPTACTTGKKLAFNPAWFFALDEESRVFLIAHEMWHVAYMHTDPTIWSFRDHRMLNIAMDHVINLMLLDHGYKFTGPGCFDARFKDHTTDQVYNILMNEAKDGPGGGGGSAGGGSSGPGGAPAEPGAPGDDLPWGQDVQAGTAKDASETLNTVIRAVTLARAAKQAGDIPGELLERIDELLKPKLKWNVLLRRWFNTISREGYSWARPNRRYQAHDMYLPAKMGEEGLSHIMFAMDSSGSMETHHLKVLNSEVHDVKRRFNPKLMTLVNFDTKIRKEWTIDEDTDFTTLSFKGRGGTKLTDVWRRAKELKPTALVVLTDLECDIPPRPGKIPVLWVCFDNPEMTVPYGTLIHLDTRAPSTP